jgi:orotate phosphoribosyltransferase
MSWQDAFDVIKRGHEHRDVPFKLASGQTSQHYIDGKHAVDTGARLAVVCRAVVDLAAERQIEFDAVGGLTMGADALAHGVAMVTGKAWFSVRKAYDKSIEAGAIVAGIIPMVDRGEVAARVFADLGVPYFPLVTYQQLGIEPITESPRTS